MDMIKDRIEKLRGEIRKTPYHKGTEHYIGKLRARIAHLEDQYILRPKKGGGVSFNIKKSGDATVVLIGPPLAGKSTLLNKLTNASSKVAPYAFTTTTIIPGMMLFKGAQIQILDLPGIIENASIGKGHGREILSAARCADLLLIMTDIQRIDQLSLIIRELHNAGLRVNQSAPEVVIKKKNSGGLVIRIPAGFKNINTQTVASIASEFHLVNTEIIIKEDLTMERLIDSFSPNRLYIKAIYIINKIDLSNNRSISLKSEFFPIKLLSAENNIGLEELKSTIWDNLDFMRIYLKKDKAQADMLHPIIVKKGTTVAILAKKISSNISDKLKGAFIRGAKVAYQGQLVGLNYTLHNEQIVTLLSSK